LITKGRARSLHGDMAWVLLNLQDMTVQIEIMALGTVAAKNGLIQFATPSSKDGTL